MTNGETDHVGRVHRLWRRELPDVALDGSAIFARARRVTQIMGEKIDPVLASHGLDGGEFFVLAALRRSGPPYALRPTELYRALMVSSGGMTDRLQRLEKQGLVRRKPSDEDRRSTLVELTPEGIDRVERAFREDMEIENAMVSALDESERRQLATLLRKLACAMEVHQPED